MKNEHVTRTLIALLILGGCTAIQAGPKFLWSSNVFKKAEGMNWICVGSMRVGEIVNPVTWFFPPPARHYFVKQDKALLLPDSSTEWIVQKNMIDFDEGQITYYYLYDTVSNKGAYISSNSASESDFKKNISNPDWKDLETEWDKNILRWLKDGKPLNPSYCS
ncbi:hypothetical protein [Synechococcus sp. EJ6-Ellesmere]|uniref:hypothetical protein n=1 Tax=Synechococcus sp. EJ6-Ellesmere TaxID=2823734 RepID=UPI0020CBAE50|nr:hypothetical protein [Synechococcus sp. EJ6-Ellesmere]